jgi:hypothetical protein
MAETTRRLRYAFDLRGLFAFAAYVALAPCFSLAASMTLQPLFALASIRLSRGRRGGLTPWHTASIRSSASRFGPPWSYGLPPSMPLLSQKEAALIAP